MPSTILLVEDNAIIALAEARMIEKHGFCVEKALNGEKALEIVKTDPSVSLILMDIDLGRGIDGTETARRVLLIRELPIIFLTSHAEKEYVDRVEEISGYGYILKNSGELVLIQSIRMAYKLFSAHIRMKESEEMYRAAFITSPDAVNINSMEGRYVDINDGFSALTGFTREEVIGRLSSEIDIWKIPEDRDRLVRELKQNGSVENLESVFRCRDGNLKTALMSARIINLNGRPHILSITRDISEKKEIEDRLKSSERRYKAIFEQAADGILIGNQHGIITDANENMTALTGYSRDELIGKRITLLFDEEEMLQRPLEFERVLKGETIQRERTIISKNKLPLAVLMNSRKVEEDCLQTIFHDLTQLNRTEESLIKSEERFRLAVEGSRDGLWDWNLKTDAVYRSPRFATMLDYEPDELPHTSAALSQLIHPEDREKALRKTNEYLHGSSEIYESTYRMRARDGSYRWIVARGKALFGSDGNAIRFVGFNTDVSAQKLAEEKSEQAMRFLENITDIAYETDSHGNVSFVNNAVEKITGFTVAEILGKSFLPLFVEQDRASLQKIYERTLKGETLENTLTFMNGATCHFTTLPRYDTRRTIIGTFGIARYTGNFRPQSQQ
jgi:PAS domain S-box-containing protein